MLNLGLGIKGKKLGGRDADTIAFMDAVGIADDSTVYYTGTPQEITGSEMWDAIDTAVLDLKSNGFWDDIPFFYPFVGGTAARHKWNLKDPRDLDVAYRGLFFGGYTQDGTGITGNGTNAYMNTLYRANLSANNGHMIGYYQRNDLRENGVAVGARLSTDSTPHLQVITRVFNTNRFFARFQSGFISANDIGLNNSTGSFLAGRNSDYGEWKMFKDTILKVKRTDPPFSFKPVLPVDNYIFANATSWLLNGTGALGYSNGNLSSLYLINRYLSDAESETLGNIDVNLQIALKRNV